MKFMTKAEFDKLPKEQKEQYIANAKAIQKGQEAIANEESALKKLTMPEFEAMIKGVIEKQIKPMTQVDRKYFAFPGIGTDLDNNTAEGKFKKTKRFLQALTDGDKKVSREMHNEVRTKANLSEADAGSGGYLVPEEFKAEILRLAPLYGVVRANSRIIPMKSNVITIPAAGSTKQSAHWIDEAKQITQTNPTFGLVTLVAKKLAAIPKVTNELLSDSSVPMIQYLSMLIAEAFAEAEDLQGFYGEGNPFIGICESTGSPDRAVCAGTISSLSYPDFIPVTGDIYTNATKGAKFYLNRTVIAMIQAITTSAGAPLFPAVLKAIYGYPVVPTETLHSVTTMGASSGSVFGVFGDPGRGYGLGERGTISMKISDQATVDSDNMFEKDMVALRAIERVAMGVLLPSYWVKLKCS